MLYSNHAQIRSRQRAIPPLVVNWLMTYGAVEYSHGAVKRFFDKKAKNKLKKEFGAPVVDRLADLLDTYIVVANDEVLVTCAHRTKRVRRHTETRATRIPLHSVDFRVRGATEQPTGLSDSINPSFCRTPRLDPSLGQKPSQLVRKTLL